jgi:PAS domain S-box-containing protein
MRDTLVSVNDIQPAADDTRERYRQKLARITLDSMVHLIGLLDANGAVIDINRAALDKAGIKLADIEGKSFLSTPWAQGADDFKAAWTNAMRRAVDGERLRFDMPGRGSAGSETIIIENSLSPVKDKRGNVVFIAIEARDVTEQRVREREIARRRDEVEAALRETERNLEAKIAERTAELVAESQERERAEGSFRLLVQGVVDYAIYMLDPHGVITNWNAGGERIKGYSSREIVGQHFSRFFTEEDRTAGLPWKALETAAREGKYEGEGWRVRKDGTRFWASVVLDPIRDRNGKLIGYAKITRDITERRAALLALQETQQQLMQAQKMEGIGHLTGGVAHDFNNLLTIIIGNLETLQRVADQPDIDRARLARLAGNAMRGAERAAALTQRLLAFSRQQPLQPKPLDVSKLVGGMSDLLRRSLGEQISIETVLAGGLWHVHADPNQLEVAILNLAVNSRDAMPDGGKLTIETSNVHLDDAYAASQVDVTSGEYVEIRVTDTGSGMPREVIERAFEPFFTTKDVGAGTGLGLSQVYGFVKQSGGHVRLGSEPGKGTTVRLYLPRLHAAAGEDAVSVQLAPPPSSKTSELILVVEDDEEVRSHTLESLADLGYRTLAAGQGRAALELLQKHPEIQLLFTDVVLPDGMNGQQLAEEAKRQRPDLNVLLTTGYARNAILRHGKVDPSIQLITKPFSYTGLAAKIRSVLDMPARSGRILLVEDELLIQMLAVDQLESLGFKVETAASATEAMRKISGDLDAAIVDVGLPDRKGDVLIGEMRALHPSMPIVIASGYGEAALQKQFANDKRIAFLAKPYATNQLKAALEQLNVER